MVHGGSLWFNKMASMVASVESVHPSSHSGFHGSFLLWFILVHGGLIVFCSGSWWFFFKNLQEKVM